MNLYKLLLFAESIYVLCTIQPTSLKMINPEPGNVFEQFFVLTRNFNGWGIGNLFFLLGILCVFYFADKVSSQIKKNGWLNTICVVFAFGTILGKSYYEIHSWSYLGHWDMQSLLALICFGGYFLIYKKMILFVIFIFQEKNWLNATTSRNKAEIFLFEKHPFFGPLLIYIVFTVPFLIAFFPGTLHWDALGQVWANFKLIEWNGIHPLFSSWLMGKSILFGRKIFHSDNIGFFCYTFSQVILQWVVFSYGSLLLSKMKSPLIIRWGTLAYFTLFPLWGIWGYTMAKDTPYYIFMLLLILVLIDIGIKRYNKIVWWQWILLILSSAASCLSKGNGLFVLIFAFVVALILWKKQWKIFIVCLFASIIPISIQNYVVMPAMYNGVTQGPIGETMTIPLQQTARYLTCYMDEVTEQERDVLSELFTCPIEEIPELYSYEISDPVKAYFVPYPTQDQLTSYYKVWFSQLQKHPSCYIEAFLNQIYGYFYPDREMKKSANAQYRINAYQDCQDGMNIYFVIRDIRIRNFMENQSDLLYRMPVFGLLYSIGFHNYVLLGCTFYLCNRKKWKELSLLLPAISVVLFNLFSPIAFLRYMLPVMAMQPFLIVWCYYVTHTEEKEDESIHN